MSENNSEPKPLDSRMVFIAIAIIAFIWVAIFIILPAVTGKAGVAQKMQDLQQRSIDERLKNNFTLLIALSAGLISTAIAEELDEPLWEAGLWRRRLAARPIRRQMMKPLPLS